MNEPAMSMIDTPVIAQEERTFRPKVDVLVWRLVALGFDTACIGGILTVLTNVFGVQQNINHTVSQQLDWYWLLCVSIIYFGVLEVLSGRTLGKWVMGLCVVDKEGKRATPAAIVLRNLLRLIDYLPSYYVFGGIVVLCSPMKQRLGDHIAGTVVADTMSVPVESRSYPHIALKLLLLLAFGVMISGFCAGFSYYGRPPLVMQGMINSSGISWQPGFEPAIRSYTLGTPQWKNGTIIYPISYSPDNGPQNCHATVTLKWHGFWSGWEDDGDSMQCRGHIYGWSQSD